MRKSLLLFLTLITFGVSEAWADVITEQITLSPNAGTLINSKGSTVTIGLDTYGSSWTGTVSGIPVSIASANNAAVVGSFATDRFQFKRNDNNKIVISVPSCFKITAYTFTAVNRASSNGSAIYYEGDNESGTTMSSNAATVSQTASFVPGTSFYFYVKGGDNANAALTMNANTFKLTLSFDIDALKTRAEELYAMRGTFGYPAEGATLTTDLKTAMDAITSDASTKTATNHYALSQAINAYITLNPNVISINFGSDKKTFSGTGGLISVGNWNNCADKSNTTGVSLNKSDGSSSGATVKWSCANTWSYTSNVTDDWLAGYLDDGGDGVSIEVSNIPYNRYSVIIYQATDTQNASFNPPSVNGTYYSWNGLLTSTTRNDTNLKYGNSQNATASLGANTILLKGFSGTLTIKGGGNANSARGCIAGIQIVNEEEQNIVVTENQTSNIATSPDYITYTGGAGTSESHVSIVHNGGSVKLTGADKTYYLSESYSGTQTTVNFDGTTANYSGAMSIGTAIYNINNTNITTPRFITSQGANGRSAEVNLTGNSVITVTGNSNVDTNQSSIMIGHWNGSSNVTLSGTAKIEAVDAQFLVGKTRNNQTITLNGSSNITAMGIKASATATGTNTLNLNGGSLTLGEFGITSYSNSTTISVNVIENSTITASASTLPISQPITVAAGKTLTIDGDNNTVDLTSLPTLGTGSAVNFIDATVTLNFNDRTLSGYTFTNCTATAQFTETGDEYKAGGFTITNIPSGVTVKVKKYDATDYETVTPEAGTATISHEVGVSGLAAWLDYTFNESTKSTNIHSPADQVITNAGNAGSGNNLTIDWSYDTANSYNEDGTLKVMSTPYRDITWPTNYTVAVAGNVPDVENGCLVAFGSSTKGSQNYLAIIRGASQNEIKLVKGHGMNSAFEVISTMTAANATALSHLVVFTKNGNTFTVYLDGVKKTQVTYSDALGGGFQIGSLHGGVTGTGVGRVNDMSAEIKAKVFAKAIRVYDYVISSDQMEALTEEFPYTSFGGKYSRTITANSNLSATDAWLNASTQGNVDVPVNAIVDAVTYYPDVEITTTAASTLTVNADMDAENIKFDGAGKLTIASDGTHNIHIYGSLTANGPVSVKYGETDLSAVPVAIGTNGSVEFDFSAYNFSAVTTSTDYPVTGNTSDYGDKVTGVYPSDIYHTYTLAHNSSTNSYYLTVGPSVALKQQQAIALVTPYNDGNHIGVGAGKYTISLGETSYTSFTDFENAVEAWASLEDCVEPTIAINQPTSAFYRIKSGSKYLQDIRKSDSATQRTLTDAEGANVSAETIFYLDNNKFVGYKTGYGFGYSVCQTQDTEHLNTQLFTESADMGKYTIQSQQGTCTSATDNVGYWGVDDSDLSRENSAANAACWTLEEVTSLPVSISSALYATLYSPVALTIPDNVQAYYISSLTETEATLTQIETTIPAETPVILKAIAAETYDFATTTSDVSYDDTNKLSGQVTAQSVTENQVYTLQQNVAETAVGLFPKAAGKLAGFKAYLSASQLTGSPSKGFVFNFDIADGIDAARIENTQTDNAIFNLAGQRVEKAQKGIYIVNGKKVLVK